MTDRKLRVAITQGDTNGIGCEIILKMLEDPRMAEMYTIVVYGSTKVAGFYRKAMNLPSVPLQRIESAADAKADAISIINVVSEEIKVEPGVPSPVAGHAALAALEAAVADLKKGLVDVLVTAPVNKKTIQSSEFQFPGHTEYLQAALCEPDSGEEALMMLCAGGLRVALATAHMPLAKVPAALTKELVAKRIGQLHASLRRDFGLERPRIAVLSLNPHAGEEGLLGTEEQEIITPAIEEARASKILAFGPYAADGFFGSGAYGHFDGVLAMYHDQGLAPFKTLAMDEGVNFTAGLPYVRTSPDHGTGYDIAAKGEANPASLRQALYLAADIWRCRNRS